MVVRVAINGYGRIGRLTHRAMVESGRTDIELPWEKIDKVEELRRQAMEI